MYGFLYSVKYKNDVHALAAFQKLIQTAWFLSYQNIKIQGTYLMYFCKRANKMYYTDEAEGMKGATLEGIQLCVVIFCNV